MAVVLFNGTPRTFTETRAAFHYRMVPSTFKFAEAPTYAALQIFIRSLDLMNLATETYGRWCINQIVGILGEITGYLGGAIALPITLAFTPVTILADVVIGIAECVFCYHQGASSADIQYIAYRKLFVSPLQQVVFCAAAIATALVATLLLNLGEFSVFFNPSFSLLVDAVSAWPLVYVIAQVAVTKLPLCVNHRSFNIFIDRGTIFINGGAGYGEWENYLTNEIGDLSHGNTAGQRAEYSAFKQGVIERNTPEELLALNDNFSQRELSKAYRTLAPVLHPDQHGNSPESAALFRILDEANRTLRARAMC